MLTEFENQESLDKGIWYYISCNWWKGEISQSENRPPGTKIWFWQKMEKGVKEQGCSSTQASWNRLELKIEIELKSEIFLGCLHLRLSLTRQSILFSRDQSDYGKRFDVTIADTGSVKMVTLHFKKTGQTVLKVSSGTCNI